MQYFREFVFFFFDNKHFFDLIFDNNDILNAELTYCKDNPNVCENKGKCIALTKEDGSYRCHCRQGYLGKNCEIIDEFLLTSTAAPRITPPPLLGWSAEDESDDDKILNSDGDNEIKSSNKTEVMTQLSKSDTIKESKVNKTERPLTDLKIEFVDVIKSNKTTENITIVKENLRGKPVEIKPVNSTSVQQTNDNKTLEFVTLPTMADIIGTATMQMNTTKGVATKKSSKNQNKINKIKTATTPTTTTATKPILKTSEPFNVLTTTMSPLNKLDEDKNLHSMPLTPNETKKHLKDKKEDDEDEDDDDEECTEDDNDDECEYVDEDDD